MSRVGVRTLLAWHRTKYIGKNITGFSIEYKHAKNLYVAMYKDMYVIHYNTPAPNWNSHIIELTQNSNEIILLYRENETGMRINYSKSETSCMNGLAVSLLEIPSSDIFTMFPDIFRVIQKATDNWTKHVLVKLGFQFESFNHR